MSQSEEARPMGLSLRAVTLMYDWANVALIFSLIVGVVATAVIIWAGNRKGEYLDRELAQSQERTAQLELARAQIEAKIAPRLLSQEQQNALTTLLKPLERLKGTIVASPSTPESEWFVRVLTAPLVAAGWDIKILEGTPTATILYPTGVVVTHSDVASDKVAINALVAFLNDAGIPTNPVTDGTRAPKTVQIYVSSKL